MKLLLKKIGDDLLFRPLGQVPSARVGLTSLFGMGRGDPHRNNHRIFITMFPLIYLIISNSASKALVPCLPK